MEDLINIRKPASNAGAGGGIESEIVVMLEPGIEKMPPREADAVTISADVEFKSGYAAHVLYSTHDKIEFKQSVVGETDGKATQLELTISHPGHNEKLESFMEKHVNDAFVLALRHHSSGRVYMLGDKGQPMYIDSSESQYGATPENSTFTTITFKGGNKRAAIYTGKLDIAADAGTNPP